LGFLVNLCAGGGVGGGVRHQRGVGLVVELKVPGELSPDSRTTAGVMPWRLSWHGRRLVSVDGGDDRCERRCRRRGLWVVVGRHSLQLTECLTSDHELLSRVHSSQRSVTE